jgi:hypothetical protein
MILHVDCCLIAASNTIAKCDYVEQPFIQKECEGISFALLSKLS